MNAMRPSSEMTGSSSAQLVTARSALSIRSASVTSCCATPPATRAPCTRVSAALARLVPALRHRPSEAVLVPQIDGHTLDARRLDHRLADERQQALEVQHTGQHPARLAHRTLIVRAGAIDVTVEQAPRDIARRGDQKSHDNRRTQEEDQFVGAEMRHQSRPVESKRYGHGT